MTAWLQLFPAWLKLAGLALLVALGAALTWWGLAPRIQLETERAGRAEQQLAAAQEQIQQQATALDRAAGHVTAIAGIEQRLRELGQTVNRNAQAQSRALEELKRNDQTVADYLAAGVPPGLGRLYERAATTDPAAYRTPPLLPAGPMQTAGPAAAAGE